MTLFLSCQLSNCQNILCNLFSRLEMTLKQTAALKMKKILHENSFLIAHFTYVG